MNKDVIDSLCSPRFLKQARLCVTGKEAFSFLQGQITQEVSSLSGTPSFCALCNTQGRVIASLAVSHLSFNDSKIPCYAVDMPDSMLPIVLATFQKYAVFSDVLLTQPRVSLPVIDIDHAIEEKKAVILPRTSEQFTPHELNYPALGWVNFEKGCYRGQEIIARMHYRGILKKTIQSVQLDFSDLSIDKNNITINNNAIIQAIKYDEKNEIYKLLIIK